MKIMMVTSNTTNDTCGEIIRQLGSGSVHQYIYSNDKFLSNVDFINDQKYFDCIYTPDPDILLKLKPKIPYFYDIPSGRFPQELNFKVFDSYYSQLGGAKAVFVCDKKMNRYAHWAGLNAYWVNDGVSIDKHDYVPKNFITPKLNIGYIYDFADNYRIVKDVIFAKNSNWVFHLYGVNDLKQDSSVKIYDGSIDVAKRSIYENCHIILNPSAPYANSITPVPSQISLEAMTHGCVSVSANIHENSDHLLFDKFHYFRLDFIDANTIIETLRYAEKRRDKLERMSKSGRDVVLKNYDAKETAAKKLDIIHKLI